MHIYAYIYTYRLVYVYKAYIFVIRIMQLFGFWVFFVYVCQKQILMGKREGGMWNGGSNFLRNFTHYQLL